jgi:hypothetical protein
MLMPCTVGATTTQPSSGAEIDLARLSETIGITMHIHKVFEQVFSF